MSCSPINLKFHDEILKLSLIPVPLQECQLSAKGSTYSESIEWLLDLKGKKPIWSRLNDINTSGYKRKLPMSMTKNYDIEIQGRLWSLWGHKRKHKETHSCNALQTSKSYMAITVMALCTARAIRLNLWTSKLMDCIWDNGRHYYKQSLKNSKCEKREFQLEYLDSKGNLEGISFKVSLKTTYKGLLYCIPLNNQLNLALALTQFLNSYQFGILECNHHLLAFGVIGGPSKGYFMFDAQSQNYPLFPQNISAPYLLRTNHLQVLLYCLIITLNVPFMQAPFCLHQVQIDILKPQISLNKNLICETQIRKSQHILPEKYWKIPFDISAKTSKSSLFDKLEKCLIYVNRNEKLKKPKYRRRIHNITKEEVNRNLIKPMVDADLESDESLKINKDYVRIICSDTMVPLLPEEVTKRYDKDFVYDLLDGMVVGPEMYTQINKIQNE